MKQENNPLTEEDVKNIIQNYLKSGGFTIRKLTDMPTDSLQVVSRKYVNLNGTTTNRPVSSILGQFYFDTSLGKPVWWDGTKFVDATGTVA